MNALTTVPQLKQAIAGINDIVFVPTMGALHEGHLSLVRLARARGSTVVASIFVNPLQFGPQEDFSAYPRTLERDCCLLAEAGCDIVFVPDTLEMYPDGQHCTVLPSPALAEILEGQYRPGFFSGVCTVVLKLFNLIRPVAAVFGAKDYQQLLIIRNIVQQFSLPIDILRAETGRDPDGLALSSRNSYLNKIQRVEAAQLHNTLKRVALAARRGRADWPALERTAVAGLSARGWRPDYIAIRRLSDLGEPIYGDRLIVLGAARLGSTRLIDNVEA